MPWKHISIAHLEMTNFKRFYGRHTLELLSQPELGKPLVLIGGDNGRGKLQFMKLSIMHFTKMMTCLG